METKPLKIWTLLRKVPLWLITLKIKSETNETFIVSSIVRNKNGVNSKLSEHFYIVNTTRAACSYAANITLFKYSSNLLCCWHYIIMSPSPWRHNIEDSKTFSLGGKKKPTTSQPFRITLLLARLGWQMTVWADMFVSAGCYWKRRRSSGKTSRWDSVPDSTSSSEPSI